MFWRASLVLLIDFWVLNLLLYFFLLRGFDLFRAIFKSSIYEISTMVDLKRFCIGRMTVWDVNSEYLYLVLKAQQRPENL